MKVKDRYVKCDDCGRRFVFRVEEQRGMARDREIVEPHECPACRANGRDGRRVTGSVKWFDQLKGFGFISREDGRGEVFVHRSDIKHVGVRVLYEGERVEFEVQRDPRGERAVHVTGHDPFAH